MNREGFKIISGHLLSLPGAIHCTRQILRDTDFKKDLEFISTGYSMVSFAEHEGKSRPSKIRKLNFKLEAKSDKMYRVISSILHAISGVTD